MAKSVVSIASEIDGFMKKETMTVWTLPWSQLYVVADRERIKEAFQNDLRSALKAQALEITYGTNAVTIHRDSIFQPREWKP
ncbi:MAG: hypothetical protein CVU20_06360 [Betaproteobacteria bacterium HGW-Betaproteobacteria-14]|nr:MAG: hypothetical protein CVU20_06360 [Betaproteobacteria bacterium HGW-Betaproteobacteria-14]